MGNEDKLSQYLNGKNRMSYGSNMSGVEEPTYLREDTKNMFSMITPEQEKKIKATFSPPVPEIPEMPQQTSESNVMGVGKPQEEDIPIETLSPQFKNNEMPFTETVVPEEKPLEFTSKEMIAPSDLVDYKGIQEQIKKERKPMGWKDFLPYLAPIVTESIFGGGRGNEAFDIAGDALLEANAKSVKREQELENKLLDIQKYRLFKKSGTLQSKALRDKSTGETVIGSYDPISDTLFVNKVPVDSSRYELAPGMSTAVVKERTGIKEASEQKMADALGKGVRTIPGTGLLGKVRGGAIVPLQDMGQKLNPAQATILEKTLKPFLSSKEYKDAASTISASSNVDVLLQQLNNPTSARFARKELAKMAEGGGKLTDSDVKEANGPMGLPMQAKRIANEQKTGMPLTYNDMQYLKQTAMVLKLVAEKKLRKSLSELEKDNIQRGGKAGAVSTAFSPYSSSLYAPSAPSAPSASQKEKAIPSRPGYTLMISPKGVKGFLPNSSLTKAIKDGYIKAKNGK